MNNTVTAMIDLKKLYAAKLIKDDDTGVSFDTPKYLPSIKSLSAKPKINTGECYAEGVLWQTDSILQNIDVELEVLDLVKEEEAFLLGHKIDVKTGGIIYSAEDEAPEVAILFQAVKGNHKNRFVCLYRGKFELSNEEYKDQEGKINYQSKKIKATFVPLKYNGQYKFRVDEEDGITPEEFFKAVIVAEKSTTKSEDVKMVVTLADGKTNK